MINEEEVITKILSAKDGDIVQVTVPFDIPQDQIAIFNERIEKKLKEINKHVCVLFAVEGVSIDIVKSKDVKELFDKLDKLQDKVDKIQDQLYAAGVL